MHEDMDRRFDEVFARIEQADSGINMNINYKFDTRLFPEIELLKQRQQSLSEQMSLRFELLARRAFWAPLQNLWCITRRRRWYSIDAAGKRGVDE